MAGNPALWADLERDLDMAATSAMAASRRAKALADPEGPLDPDARSDREQAVGYQLHNCYGALESVLERLINALDGSVPAGRDYHGDLVNRAAAPVGGVRPAILSPDTAALLHRLRAFRHAFRHAYAGYSYDRAVENVAIADRLVPAFRAEITSFAAAMAIAPGPSA
jgi:hypothetical protein